jgi:hypothetical protein
MSRYFAEKFRAVKAKTFDTLPPINVDELGKPVKYPGGTAKGSVVLHVHACLAPPVSYKMPYFATPTHLVKGQLFQIHKILGAAPYADEKSL